MNVRFAFFLNSLMEGHLERHLGDVNKQLKIKFETEGQGLRALPNFPWISNTSAEAVRSSFYVHHSQSNHIDCDQSDPVLQIGDASLILAFKVLGQLRLKRKSKSVSEMLGKNSNKENHQIFIILGTPNEMIWERFSELPRVKFNFEKNPHNNLRKKFQNTTSFMGLPVLSVAGLGMLNNLITYDPKKRITADAALNHEWFCEVPLPKSKEFMLTFPAQHAQDR
ncbi:hypothetical protein FXO37_21236 [Capsicum annuum]|nr:hypothetical protein FXO37_21236 [Capsicum annuum]